MITITLFAGVLALAAGSAGAQCVGDANNNGFINFADYGAVAQKFGQNCVGAPYCGNAVVDPGEECDQGKLGGATCASEGFAAGALACGSNCVHDTSGCHDDRFIDNGDGTISDLLLGLMWEKKVKLDSTSEPSSLQDADNVYPFSGTCSLEPTVLCQPDSESSAACFAGVESDPTGCAPCGFGQGTCTVASPGMTIWQWLGELNAAGFAGHDDWRIAKVEELATIRVADWTTAATPVVDGAFHRESCGASCTDVALAECACTPAAGYWSATTRTLTPANSWRVNFDSGGVGASSKATSAHIRAVRGVAVADPSCGAVDCGPDLTQCTGDLAACTVDRLQAESDLAACTADLGTCNAGTAVAGDVLTGKTFSSAAGLGGTGAMPNRGAVNITPGTSAQTIAAGFHNGSGSVAGDTDLVAGNIRSGVNLFGVNGSSTVVNTSGATAVAGDILTGKTAYVNGSLVTGNVAAGANVSGANGSKTFTIPNGLYTGSKTATANDTDLVASNILSGVNLFGVTGSLPPAQRLKTGQTQCWDASNTLVSCTGTGQDGEVQKGLTVSFTDNGNGTISDSRTGLMWERLNDGGGINDKDAAFTWYNAFNKIKVMNGNATGCIAAGNPSSCCTGAGTGSGCTAFAGHTDWRLPNVNELQSLANYGTFSPATHAAFNSSCTTSCTTCSCTRSSYWSASTYAPDPVDAWFVNFSAGLVYANPKASFYYVRAVRGGS